MKILFLCGVYADEHEHEVLENTKGYVEQSANIFQKKLIGGIKENNVEYKVISAPFIGAYPMRYKSICFNGFSSEANDIEYVHFNNIWGVRNLSRTYNLKKSVNTYLTNEKEDEFLILVYCPHTPLLEAAVYAKSLKPKSKICLVVPDLPQYMNLNETGRGIYDFLKKFDIKHMEKLIDDVDSFVLLTEPMAEVLRVGKRPYIVVEGLIDDTIDEINCSTESDGLKRIVYTGKLNTKFGVRNLVDSFMRIDNPAYRLVLCGDGDTRAYIEKMGEIDRRIEYKGMVTAAHAKEIMKTADVLVNPRPNNEEYTKYSFPSKNIEYLMTGKPVVAYMLDGMPAIYQEFLYVIPNNTHMFEKILVDVCEGAMKKTEFRDYANKMLSAERLVRFACDLLI